MKILDSKSRGFTIVELLVVIVVIGILAAITMVSYSGVKNKADTATNQSNANSVAKSVASFYASNGSYPTATVAAINTNNVAKLAASIDVSATAPTSSTTAHIGYTSDTDGACISYWDLTDAAARYLGLGTATITVTSGENTACAL